MPKVDSVYKYTNDKGEVLLNRGFNYKDVIMKRTTSSYFQKNENIRNFIVYLNDIFFTYIEAVKRIRVYYNFNVSDDYTKIN